MSKKVGVCPEERALPYFHFYQEDPGSHRPGKTPDSPKWRFLCPRCSVEERELFLEGKDGEYCQARLWRSTQRHRLCLQQDLHAGCHLRNADWWFPWHSVGS